MVSPGVKSKVNKLVLLMSILYGAFAMVDDSSWLEGSILSCNYIDQCVNVDAQDDATPWLSLGINQHRNFRTLAKETQSGYFIYQHQFSNSSLSKWTFPAFDEAARTTDLSSLICTFRI